MSDATETKKPVNETKKVKHSGLFIETDANHVGRFTVIKDEWEENPRTKRKVHKPGLVLTTVWGEGTKGFVYLKRLTDPQVATAKSHFGKEWFDRLCETVEGMHGLTEINDDEAGMKAFETALAPTDGQATGARQVGQKKSNAKPSVVINVSPVSAA